MKRENYRLLLFFPLIGILLGAMWFGPSACTRLSHDTAVSGASAEKENAGAGATAPAVLPLKDHHRKAGLSCRDCHDSQPPGAVGSDACLACHGTSEAVAQATADLKPNPHDSVHYGPDLGCDLCHHEHGPSENFCNSCHEFVMTVP